MTPTSGQTAMVLAGLPAADRDWVLQHLAPARASQLGALIDDASRLGIGADAALLGNLMDALDRRVRPDDARAQIARAQPAQLCALLHDAPALLIARLLAAHDWPWTQAFIARLPGSQRRDVLDAGRGPARDTAPAAAEAIIDSLARRLRGQPAVSEPPVRKTRLERLAGLIKARPIIGATRGAR